jgi:histone H3/H4
LRLGRDVDLADSTFRFDIPFDAPESDLSNAKVDIANDAEEVEDGANSLPDLEIRADASLTEQALDEPDDESEIGLNENAIDNDEEIYEAEPDNNIEEAEDPTQTRQDQTVPEANILPESQAEDPEFDDSGSEFQAREAGAQNRAPVVSVRPLENRLPHLAKGAQKPVARKAASPAKPKVRANPRPKVIQKSRHGIDVPSLPVSVVKGVAESFIRSSGRNSRKLSKDTVDALKQATDWFFEQVSDDLDAYSKHADRATIEESDVTTLMRRQRLLNATTTPFSLAQKFLPRELLQELRMEPPEDVRPSKRSSKNRFEAEHDRDAY